MIISDNIRVLSLDDEQANEQTAEVMGIIGECEWTNVMIDEIGDE